MTLPTDYDERKGLPLWTFLMEYFPLAFLALVRISVAGDKQHLNNSEPGKIRWAREKSTDQLNTALRHQFDYGTGQKYDVDGHPHLGKAMWRLGAQLQLDEEERLGLRLPSQPRTATELDPKWQERITVLRCCNSFAGLGRCTLSDNHPGRCKYEGAPTRPPSICFDCGVDLEEGVHAPGCLRLNNQHY